MFVIYLENILDNDVLVREFHWVIHARFSEISNYDLFLSNKCQPILQLNLIFERKPISVLTLTLRL